MRLWWCVTSVQSLHVDLPQFDAELLFHFPLLLLVYHGQGLNLLFLGLLGFPKTGPSCTSLVVV